MQLRYEQAIHLEGKMIRFKNKEGDWSVGRIVKVKKDGVEIEELLTQSSSEGYGFWGPGPFFGPPGFFAFAGFGFSPFFFW